MLKNIFLIFFIFLGACAHRPPTLLIPIEHQPESAITKSVLAFSTRAVSETPYEHFTGDRGTDVTKVIVDVSIPSTHEKGQLEWPTLEAPNPETQFSTKSVRYVEDEDIPVWFSEQDNNGQVLIFVHGFNVHFSEAIYRLAQISYDLDIDASPMLFTWPSKGKMFSYLYDKESASYSRDALEGLIYRAAQRPEVDSITILGHSMGGWLTMEALRQYAIRHDGLDPKIQNIILASPDIDINVFQKQITSLGKKRPHLTLLISDDDRALSLSSLISGNIDRLGDVDPNDPEFLEAMRNTHSFTVVDLTDLKDGGSMHHSKFAETTTGVDFISNTISSADQNLTSSVKSLLVTFSKTMEASKTIFND